MPKRRQQIEMTPAEIEEFLHGRETMSVATLNWDSTLHLTAMWYGFLDGAPALFTYAKSQKVRNLERDPRLTGLIETGDRYDEVRGVELVGTGEIIRDPEIVLAVGTEVYGRYFAPVTDETMPMVHTMSAKRVVVRIDVTRTVSWDHRKLGGQY
jgi:PPOX class probable F420-dependent enzyme